MLHSCHATLGLPASHISLYKTKIGFNLIMSSETQANLILIPVLIGTNEKEVLWSHNFENYYVKV